LTLDDQKVDIAVCCRISAGSAAEEDDPLRRVLLDELYRDVSNLGIQLR